MTSFIKGESYPSAVGLASVNQGNRRSSEREAQGTARRAVAIPSAPPTITCIPIRPPIKALPMSDPTITSALNPDDLPTQADRPFSPKGDPIIEKVGDYELLYELGRGGMGVVFKARDVKLNRLVAVKMILPGALPDATDLQRFHTEASAAASLKHPNIVTVHAVGQQNGRWYYCMDLIEGPTLAMCLKDGPLPGRVAARYMAAVARHRPRPS